MDEFIKVFREFISRDLVFILSGALVVATFLYIFKRFPQANVPWFFLVLFAGIAYFVAYAIQDLLCIFGILPSAPVKDPNVFVRYMYERLYHKQNGWKVIIQQIDLDEARHKVPLNRQPELERLITLQQIGTAGGPCMFLSGIGFFIKWLYSDCLFDLAVAVSGCFIGLVLVSLAWLKAAQRAQLLANMMDQR